MNKLGIIKFRMIRAVIAFIALSSLALLTTCTKDPFEDHLQNQANLKVNLETPRGFEAEELDAIWIRIENLRSGEVDSILSEHCKSIYIDLEIGRYNVEARGIYREGRDQWHLAAVERNLALKSGMQVLNLKLVATAVISPPGQEDEGVEIQVKVLPPQEMPDLNLKDITVTLTPKDGGDNISLTTNEEGLVIFKAAQGQYIIEAKKKIETPDGEPQKHLFGVTPTIEVKDESLQVEIETKIIQETYEGDCNLTVEVVFPSGLEIPDEILGQIEFSPIGSGDKTLIEVDSKESKSIVIPTGHYLVNAFVQHLDKTGFRLITYTNDSQEIELNQKDQTVKIQLKDPTKTSAVLIQEIYFTNSAYPDGKQYLFDTYVQLYNNSPFTVYLDGLAFSRTHNIVELDPAGRIPKAYVGTEWVMPEFIFVIPGEGKERKLEPGKTFLFADQAQNHKDEEKNPNSPVDLSIADYEWYEDNFRDVDNPFVPNLIVQYTRSKSITLLHNRGYSGYFIWYPEIPIEQYMDEHNDMGQPPNPSFPPELFYIIHTDVIVDAVSGSHPENGVKFPVLPASVETGYTYCDGKAIGKSIKRKILKKIGDRYVLQDTNNSTNDFIPNATPKPREVIP